MKNMRTFLNETPSFFKDVSKILSSCYNSILERNKDFIKHNPLLVPLLFFGANYVISALWNFLKSFKDTIRGNSISSFKHKYKGDWAFVADVSKTFGAKTATLLAKNGYNILTLIAPEFSLSQQIKLMGKKVETVEVSPFCSSFNPKDLINLETALKNKTLGVIIMNFFYESPCHFESEFPTALLGSVNACVIKTAIFLDCLMSHIEKQSNRVALMTTGSVLGGSGWPGFQITSGCARSIEKLTESLKRDNVDILHLRLGYVPSELKKSYYLVRKEIEAEKGLTKIGISEKAFADYRTKLQDLFQNSKFGKPNRFAYGRLALLQRYIL